MTSLLDMERLVDALDEPANRHATVVVIGHADGRDTPEKNQELGLNRARAVESQLRQLGINVVPVTAEHSFGSQFPIGDNQNEVGRALNRRVELWVKR